MDGASQSTRAYAFAGFRLDVGERLLVREDGTRIPLRDKVFDTLVALVESAGKLVTREQLLDAIWPDTVVEESNLSHNISVLRRTLGPGGAGKYIETVPKRGYRFVAPIEAADGDAGATDAGESRTEVTAGRKAYERGEWQRAYEQLAAAAEAGALEPSDWALLADAARWSGQFDERISWLERGTLALRATAPEAAAKLLVELAIDHLDQRRASLAASCVHEARRLVTDPESDVHCWLAWLESRFQWDSCDWEAATEQAWQVVDVSRKHGCRCVEAIGLLDVGHTLVAREHFAEATGPLEEAGAAALSGELPIYSTGFLYCGMIFAWRAFGDFGRASEWTEASLRWCERQNVAYFPGTCRAHRGELIRLRGWLAEAERDLENGCEQLAAADSWRAGLGFRELGEVRLRLGDLDGAEEAFQSALELGTLPQPGMARLRAARGEVAEAFADLGRALHEEGHAGILERQHVGHALPVFVTLALAVGEIDRAKEAALRLQQLASATGSNAYTASADGAFGEILLAEGHVVEAIDRLRRSWQAWCRLDAPYEASVCRTKLAEALLQTGDRLGARMELAAAASTFGRIGAVLDQKQAEQRGREIDAAPRVRPSVETTACAEIVDSAALEQLLGEAGWNELLAWYERQIQDAPHAKSVSHAGPCAAVGFDDASAAVRWAQSLHQRLRDHRQRNGFAPPVRIGIAASCAEAAGHELKDLAHAVAATATTGDILVTRDVLSELEPAVSDSSTPRGTVNWRGSAIDTASLPWTSDD